MNSKCLNEKYTSLNIHQYIWPNLYIIIYHYFIYISYIICLFQLYSSAQYAVHDVTTEFMDVDGEPEPEHDPEPARDVYEQDTIIDDELYSYLKIYCLIIYYILFY